MTLINWLLVKVIRIKKISMKCKSYKRKFNSSKT